MYRIQFSEGVAQDLRALPPRRRREILDWIDVQLKHEPQRATRNRKPLPSLVPPWEHSPPIWELRISEYRVFYDVSAEMLTVFVRAIRHKPPHRTTEEIV